MLLLRHQILFTIVLLALPLSTMAEEERLDERSPAWDRTVNSLLVTSMYGIPKTAADGFSLHLSGTGDFSQETIAPKAYLKDQSITFSYDGSAGLLGFSTGYILTSEPSQDTPGTVFLGINELPFNDFSPKCSWYMAFGLSSSYQVDELLNFGFDSTLILKNDPFSTNEGRAFSMLFNIPVNYNNYLTITPQFQWTRNFPELPQGLYPNEDGYTRDSFYGGVSLSFSY